jgi:hypothetical protein
MTSIPRVKTAKAGVLPESVSAELDALHARLVTLENRIKAQGDESRSMASAHRISLEARHDRLRIR